MRLVLAGILTAASVFAIPGAAEAAAPTLKFSKIQYDAPGPDTRANSQLNREFVVLKNTGSKTVQLKDWTLADAQRHKYRFPTFRLKPRTAVTIHTGMGRNTAKHLYMNRKWYIWNNTTDTATLRNAAGKKILTKSWGRKPPAPTPGNDPRFDTCTDAKDAGYGPYYEGRDPEYQWYQDRDGDGVVCE